MKNKERLFAIYTSLILTLLFFCILFTNIKSETFVSVGDQGNLCYPSFIRLGFFLKRGIFSGVDISTCNGATEFFSRSNLTTMYPVAMFFAFLGETFSNQYFMYNLLLALHFFAAIYCAQRLGTVFFGLNRYMSFLFSCSCLMIYSYELWYTGFAIISMFVLPLFYISLKLINEKRKRCIILYSIPYAMAFTTGYITISVVLIGMIFLVTCAYILCYINKNYQRKAYRRFFAAFCIGGGVSLLYYFQLYVYATKIIPSSKNALAHIWELSLNLDDIWVFALSSYYPSYPIEQYDALTMGIVWVIALLVIFVYRKSIKIERRELIFHNIVIMINLLLILLTFGNATPVITWFYSMVPILGKMHLPIRYMMVTMPFLYLVLCIEINSLPDLKGKIIYRNLSILMGIIMVVSTIVLKAYPLKNINTSLFIFEMLLAAVILFKIYENGWNDIKTVSVWCVSLILMAGVSFNSITVPNIASSIMESSNIYYNNLDHTTLNNYLNRNFNKLLQRYFCYDQNNLYSPFVPHNFPWYESTETELSSYYGYESQLAWPKNYVEVLNGGYTQINWQYVKDTRGDFVILTPDFIENNKQLLDTIIDWDRSKDYLTNGMRICTLKKFVPFYYTGNGDTLDLRSDPLDNGYFYSPQLSGTNLISFETDRSRYFKAEINAGNNESDITFLPYASQYYKYYIDGQEVEPIIANSQAYLRIPQGIHEIKVIYKNTLGTLGGIILISYYFLVVLYAGGLMLIFIIKRKRR